MRPEFKNKQKSIERVEALLEDVGKKQIDLIVLPEMALIGYKFISREDIFPHCEEIAKTCSEATS